MIEKLKPTDSHSEQVVRSAPERRPGKRRLSIGDAAFNLWQALPIGLLAVLSVGGVVWQGIQKKQEQEQTSKIIENELDSRSYAELKRIYGDYAGYVIGGLVSERVRDQRDADAESQTIWKVPGFPEAEDVVISDGSGGTEVLSAGTVELILRETYPEGWVRGEIKRVVSNATYSTTRNYGLKKELEAAAFFDRVNNHIGFTRTEKPPRAEELIHHLLSHEVAHGNDWVSDQEMSPLEKANLLLAVTRRLSEADRHMSEFVESIGQDGSMNQHEMTYFKAVEYWAEISTQYLRNPHSLHAKDFDLVDARVRTTDPDFDPVQAFNLRQNIIDNSNHP